MPSPAPAPARLALLGDVHANLPALDAVLAAVRAAGLERGVCTGDLVMRGAQPEECVARVRALGWPCVRGNTDHKVARRPPPGPDHPKAARVGSRAWSANRLSTASRRYLGGLPVVARLEVGGVRVAVMHGGPDDPREVIGAHTPDTVIERIASALEVEVLVNGHTHAPLVRAVGHRYGHVLLVNPGSVGEGIAADRRPAWAWLEAHRGRAKARLERVAADLASVRTS